MCLCIFPKYMFIWYIWKVFYPSHASMNNGRYVENGDDFYCSPVDELLVVIICDCDSFFLSCCILVFIEIQKLY